MEEKEKAAKKKKKEKEQVSDDGSGVLEQLQDFFEEYKGNHYSLNTNMKRSRESLILFFTHAHNIYSLCL